MIIVSDTSPINYLVLIDEIELLHTLYDQILLPPAVHVELQHPNTPSSVVDWAQHLPYWVKVKAPQQLVFAAHLNPGESQAIALAIEENAILLLIDEQRGRAFARQQGLTVTGTLGVLEDGATRLGRPANRVTEIAKDFVSSFRFIVASNFASKCPRV